MPYTPNSSIYQAAREGNVTQVDTLLKENIDPTTPDKLNSRTPLHYALMISAYNDDEQKSLRANKIKIAKMLINKAPNTLGYQDTAGDTPMHFMASNGFDDLLEEAIRQNPQAAFIANNAGASPIHAAIANQEIKTATLLLTIPKMPEVVDTHGRNLFHHCAEFNNIQVLELLIKDYPKSLDHINDTNNDFKTPLDIAYEYGFQSLIDEITDHGGVRSNNQDNTFN